jgi:hypothetical protein
MELESDKEIDALLRKARPPAAAPVSGHLDADAMNAFAEGALPEAIRRTYTAHFADCDTCRMALSQIALLDEPLATKAVAAAASAPRAASPWPPKAVPWYRSLFRSPGLAAAMGVLVVAFGGVLVYLMTQRGNGSGSSVAMQKEVSNAAAPFSYTENGPNSNAAAASSMSNTAVSNSSNSVANRSAANTISNAATTTATKESAPPPGASAGGAVTGTTTAQPTSSAAAAPGYGLDAGRKIAEDKPKTEPEERKDADTRETARALSEDRLARGDAPAKKAAGGPMRSTGPMQVQNQVNTQSNMQSDMALTRRSGGKTFHNSNGAWYDSAYNGQATTNVHRGTDEFKKLDSGLRSIANDLGGVVVVVWKNKAFRIQ